MKKCAAFIAVYAMVALAATGWAGEDSKEPRLLLELNLLDGSRVVGTPAIESLPVQTSYAKMDIPLKQILNIKMGEDHETASVDLQNGDKLKGLINLAPIKLETVFGKVTIGVEYIHDVRIIPSRNELMHGLVLSYSFDREDNEKVIDNSGHGNNGSVCGAKWIKEGKVGGAYEFAGAGNTLEIAPNCLDDLSDATICFWVKTPAEPKAYDLMVFEHQHNNYVRLDARIQGAGKGMGLCAGVEGRWEGTGQGTLSWDKWCHFVGVLGLGGLKLYINGRLMSENPDCKISFKDIGRSTHTTLGRTWFTGPHIGGPCWFKGALDEFMIFNRALSEKEIKQLYDIQK